MSSILWCTSHYKAEFCKAKVKELRNNIQVLGEQSTYTKVALVDKLVEDGIQYNRIRLYYK